MAETRMSRMLLVMFCMVLMSSICLASFEPIVVQLPELEGSYSFQDGGKVASFDLGESIPFEIGSVLYQFRLIYAPFVTPAKAGIHCYSVEMDPKSSLG